MCIPAAGHLPDGDLICNNRRIVEPVKQYIGNETNETSTRGRVLILGRRFVRHWNLQTSNNNYESGIYKLD